MLVLGDDLFLCCEDFLVVAQPSSDLTIKGQRL